MTTTTLDPTPGPLRTVVVRHPIGTFVVLVLGAGWPILAVPALAGGLPMEPFALATTLLVLLPAALWITSVTEGRAGVRALVRRAVHWRFGVGWWVAILLGLPAAALGTGWLLGGALRPLDVGAFLAGQLFQLVTAMVVINLAEEVAWAGFLQTRLARRHGLFIAALLTAVPFALLHAPLLLADGSFGIGLGILVLFGLVTRPLVGVTMTGAGGSVLAAAALHAVFNQVANEGGLLWGWLAGPDRYVVVLLATIVLTGVLTVAMLRAANR